MAVLASRRRMGSLVAALAAVAAVALSGCATTGRAVPAGETGPTREWRGRFSLSITRDDGAAAEPSSGRFALVAGGRFSDLQLISPLGNTIASARTDETGATLRVADGRQWRADSIDELTERVVGWRIPVGRLPDWLDGRVARPVDAPPGSGDGSATTGEPELRPVGGSEDGWLVRFEQWGDRLPRRLTLVYPGRVRLRLIVDDR
jgi:outer membrane lipoprotein LolB